MAEAQNITVKTGGCPWWVLLLVLLFGTALGFFLRGKYQKHEVLVQTDTLIFRETITIEHPPVEKHIITKDTMLVKVRDTVTIHDTTYVVLNKEVKEYRGESYYAVVSGYQPSLDFIEVYPETKVVTSTETILPNKNNLSLGIDIGYLKGFHAPIYIEYERKLHRNFSFKARIMHDFISQENGVSVGVKAEIGW
jgi:hypothetical protein